MANIQKYKSWTIANLKINNQWVTREELNQNEDTNLGQATFNRIKYILNLSLKKYEKNSGTSTSIKTFFEGYKKGSSRVRKILCEKYNNKKKGEFRQVNTHFANLGLEKPETDIISVLYGTWKSSFIPSTIQTFNFKLMNNTLGVGARVIHINRDYEAGCVFCTITHNRPVPIETVEHTFWYCPVVSKVLDETSRYFLGFTLKKKEWFGLNFNLKMEELSCLNILFTIIKFVIWSNRLRKKLINSNLVITETNYHIGYIFESSPKIRDRLTMLRHYLIAKRRD